MFNQTISSFISVTPTCIENMTLLDIWLNKGYNELFIEMLELYIFCCKELAAYVLEGILKARYMTLVIFAAITLGGMGYKIASTSHKHNTKLARQINIISEKLLHYSAYLIVWSTIKRTIYDTRHTSNPFYFDLLLHLSMISYRFVIITMMRDTINSPALQLQDQPRSQASGRVTNQSYIQLMRNSTLSTSTSTRYDGCEFDTYSDIEFWKLIKFIWNYELRLAREEYERKWRDEVV